jgi:hypothetical protein
MVFNGALCSFRIGDLHAQHIPKPLAGEAAVSVVAAVNAIERVAELLHTGQ